MILPDKALIINPFGIGDVLFTTPIIRALKDAYPGIKIGYLCNRRTAPLLRNNPNIDSTFIYERDDFEQIRRKSFFLWVRSFRAFLDGIKKEQFNLAFDFSLNIQYGFFCWLAGIKTRIGYDYKKRGEFLTKKVGLTGYSAKHIVEYYADLLKYLGLALKHPKLELFLNENDKRKAEEILAKESFSGEELLVGIIPAGGRSWGRDAYLKHWSAQNFAQLADKIVENYKAKIIIMGDSSEGEIANSVKESMHHNSINLSGAVSLGEFAALINRMDLLVTNDGGPLHMAVALGKKTVSFFGPVDPKVYGPYPADERQHIVLRKNLECSPCYIKFRLSDCKRNRECLETIDVDSAFNAVRKIL